MHVGGNYNQNQNHGLFYLNGNNAASNKNANIGSRFLANGWHGLLVNTPCVGAFCMGIDSAHLSVKIVSTGIDLVPSASSGAWEKPIDSKETSLT